MNPRTGSIEEQSATLQDLARQEREALDAQLEQDASLTPSPTASPWPQPADDNGDYARGVRS